MRSAATSGVQWKIAPFGVQSFQSQKMERHHVKKHVLNPDEQWATLSVNLAKAVFRATAAASPAQLDDLMDALAHAYVGFVQTHTCEPKNIGAVGTGLHLDEGRYPIRVVHAWTRLGLYVSFQYLNTAPSVLMTAMRPIPRLMQPPFTQENYVYLARKKYVDRQDW